MQPQADVSPMHPAPFRVLERREEIPGCVTMRVEAADGRGDCAFASGQFYMIYVFGHGEIPISVSGDSSKAGELTFTIMGVGSVTEALCAIEPGGVIGLRGPFGSAWPVGEIKARNVIVMAGGLGLAPLRPALYHMMHNRAEYGELTLLYGTRQPQSIVFSDELAGWRKAASMNVDVTVDNAGREWPGKVGVVTDLLKGRKINPDNTVALICGPEVMMRFSAYALIDRGLKAENVYVSMERNMKCAIRMCGRCQYGPYFICHDGPVFSFDRVERLFEVREL